MITEVIHGSSAFDALALEWDALAGQGMTDTPFQTLAYQRAWWTHLHPESAELQTVTVRDDEGALLAIGSFYVQPDGVVHFNGCVEETDYLDLICRPEHAEAAWRAVCDAMCAGDFTDWKVLDLCNVPADSPSRELLPQLAADQNLTFDESIHEVCPVIALPETFEAYLEGIDSKQRREIRRKLRRADAADAVLHIVGPEEDLNQAVDDFLELLQKSTFEKRDWLNEGRRAVFHETARAASAAGTLQLMFMELNGEKGAALLNFDYRDRIWVYNSGLDPSAYSALSLGVVLTARAIEVAIENGRSTFDFLRGDEEYKYRFGAQDTRIYRLQLQR